MFRNRAVAFISTFACFLTRGFDQLRMGVISQTNLNVVGSHAGLIDRLILPPRKLLVS
jgi:transketolase